MENNREQNAETFGIVDFKTRVQRVYPNAYCRQHGRRTFFITEKDGTYSDVTRYQYDIFNGENVKIMATSTYNEDGAWEYAWKHIEMETLKNWNANDYMKIAYKLFKLRSDGTIGSLFIDKKSILPVNKWLKSKPIRTKGYAFREGWHCCATQSAPHLSKVGRVWGKVAIIGVTKYIRPESQGGIWYTAKKMKILEILD